MGWLPRGRRVRGVLLIATVLVVVAATMVGPAVLPETEDRDEPDYDIKADLAEPAPADGQVSVDKRDQTGVVLVDLAHGNRMSPKEFKPLLAGLTDAGWQIELLERTDGFDQSLTRADAFIVIDPSLDYSTAEINRVDAFVDRGGRLLLIGEPTTTVASGLSVQIQENKLTGLSSQFGFEFGEAYLFNMERNDGNHQNVFAEPVSDHQLTSGLSRTAFYAATQLNIREGQPVLMATEGTRSSRTDDTGSYPMAAVNGNVLAIADGTFLRRGNFNVVDNDRLVRNVVRFLVAGENRRSLDAYPTFVSEDPSILFTDPALTDAAQLLSADIRTRGDEPELRIRGDAVSPNGTDVLITTFGYLERHGPLETGISISGDRLQVAGYTSHSTGILVIRAPRNGFDLVIAADTPNRAQQAVEMLVEDSIENHLMSPRTAIVRSTDTVTDTEESAS